MIGSWDFRCSRATVTTIDADLSLGVVDSDIELGSELTLVWGEENGGTTKPTVERHRQCEVRVKVAPVPYSSDARDSYHAGWRSRQR